MKPGKGNFLSAGLRHRLPLSFVFELESEDLPEFIQATKTRLGFPTAMTSRVWTRCLALQLGRVEARSLSHQFHSSGKLNARFPRASSTKEKQRNPGYDKRNDLAELREEDLPTGLFFQASRDGILPVDPSKAIDIARGCMMGIEAGRNPTAEVGQHICDCTSIFLIQVIVLY